MKGKIRRFFRRNAFRKELKKELRLLIVFTLGFTIAFTWRQTIFDLSLNFMKTLTNAEGTGILSILAYFHYNY